MTMEAPPEFLSGGGTVGAMIRALDWSATPLGPISTWPQSLRTSVSICLNSSFPILIWWGPHLVKIYNDAYATIIADKHPRALGSPGREVWPEIWDQIGPMLARVMEKGEACPADDLLLILHRHGYPEECYFSFSYSPIRDETGGVGGVFCPVVETTKRVFAERRSSFLLRLEARLRDIHDPLAVKTTASEMLATYLDVSQAGYADVIGDGSYVSIEGNFNDGRLPNAKGLHRFGDHDPAVVADLTAGKIVQVRDIASCEEATVAAYRKAGISAFLNIPLMKAGQLRSILFVHHHQPRVWSEEDIAVAGDVAARTWSAVQRANAEVALRHSEEEFRTLGENLPSLCWMARADGWIYWYNKGWYDYTGTTPAEMEGWGWQRVQDPETLPVVMERWNAALATGSKFDMTFPLRGADGVFRPFLTRIVPVRDSNGTITRWFGNNVEITELRDAEQRLRVSEAKLRTLNETLEQQVEDRTADRDRMWRLSTDIMLVARFEGAIVAANPAWTSMLGWPMEDVQGRSFMEFIHPDDAAEAAFRISLLSEGQPVHHFENRYRHRDGSYRWLAWSAVPDAGLIHAVGRDITAEKNAASQLEAAQERLRQAQRMEALGQLAGGIAHDFNNVLQAITGGVELIRMRADDPTDVTQIADMVAGAAARGASITRRLLSFSRQGALQSVPVDSTVLLDGLAEMLTHTLGRDLDLKIHAEAGIPALLADRAQLETVLVNLAVNARDAMPDGGTLIISARAETVPEADTAGVAAGDYIRITVADTGAGMDSATLARAGEPFFSTKPPGQGTGLGLAMARGFCEQSGGAFSISSTLGVGTTVTLWLPRAGDNAFATQPAETVDATTTLIQTSHVLLVDDDTMVRSMFAEHLSAIGYRVTQATDGLDALSRLDAGGGVDLLITDFAMPGMNGLLLIAEARQRLPGLPVLLLTGYVDAAVWHRIVHSIGDEVALLRKPISSVALAARTAALLKSAAVGAG